MSINSITIGGNLTRDPELRETGSGMAILSMSVAVNERVKDGESWVERPNYVDCTMFGKRAASVAQYLAKGSKVTVQGHVRQERWEKDGKNQSKLVVIVDDLEFMSRQGGQPQQPQPQAQAPAAFDFDLPF